MTLVDYGQGQKRPRWPLPQGVFTGMTESELTLLQEYAADHDVLEFGSLCGYSAIGMALAGARVLAVDPHYDGPANAPDTWGIFQENVNRHMVGDKITAARMASQEWDAEASAEWTFDLVFVDADHTWPQPWFDCQIAERRLQPQGWLAIHDVHHFWPGVLRACHNLELAGWRRIASTGSLRIYQK